MIIYPNTEIFFLFLHENYISVMSNKDTQEATESIGMKAYEFLVDNIKAGRDIDKDREKQYMPALLPAIWGTDYMNRAEELRDLDDNFRRIFKRVHPIGII